MRIVRNVYSVISSGYKLFARDRSKKSATRILLYHSVGTDLPHDTYGMTVSIEAFKDQIKLLSEDRKVEIVSLNSSEYNLLWNENDDKLRLAITFDDGYKNNLYFVSPILLEYGFPFTVFVTANLAENSSSVYLSEEELLELSCLPGVTIGSHGMKHNKLTELNDRNLRCELADSRSKLEDIIGRTVDMLSYPYGKANFRVMEAALKCGYCLGAGSRFGANFIDNDPMFLKRTEIWDTDSVDVFHGKYMGAWDWYGSYQRLRGM